MQLLAKGVVVDGQPTSTSQVNPALHTFEQHSSPEPQTAPNAAPPEPRQAEFTGR